MRVTMRKMQSLGRIMIDIFLSPLLLSKKIKPPIKPGLNKISDPSGKYYKMKMVLDKF